MAATAKFGIATSADLKAMDSLLEKLNLVLKAAETVSKAGSKFADSYVQDEAKKTTAAKQSSERVKGFIADRVNAEEAAAKRRVETEERAAQLTKSVENMTTEALVDDIFKLQQKREAAIRARNAATAEGAKGEVAEQKKVIASLDEELGTLKKVSIQRKEVQKEGAGVKIGQIGTGRQANKGSHGGGINPAELLTVAGLAEGLEGLANKAKEVDDAQHQLAVGSGKTGDALKEESEDAKKMGFELGVTGTEAEESMGKVAGITHDTGDKLKQETEAAIAYHEATGKSAEKLMATEAGRAKIMADAEVNIANARKAALEPAKQAELAQKGLEEEDGELASTLLQGLAPILADLTPLVQTLGDVANGLLTPALKAVGFILAPVMEGLKFLKPILPELSIGLGILAVALNATAIATWLVNAAMAVNSFVWFGLAVVALIGIVVLLVKHWDEVIATVKKVFSAITDAGGAVLEFLGITSKASAETSKHTKALKDNKKSLEEIKQATVDATKAADDYTDAIKKNLDESEKSAKEGEDNAIAAIQDIDAKLADSSKRLKGDTEESLKAVRAQWVEHGKLMVKQQTEQEAAQHKASLEIGASVDKDAPKAKKPKKGTTPEELAKAEADRVLSVAKDSDAKLNETDAQHRSAELKAEAEHAATLLAIARKYNSEDSKIVADAELTSLAAQKNFDALTLNEIGEKTKANLAAQKQAVEDSEKLQAEQDAKELKMQAESDDVREQMRVDSIASEYEKRVAEENDRFGKELSDKEADIYNADGTLNALGESLWANHQGKMLAIAKQGAEEQRKVQQEQIAFLLGPVVAGYDSAMKGLEGKFFGPMLDRMQKSKNLGTQAAGAILGDFEKMAAGMISKVLATAAMNVATAIATGTTIAAAYAPAAAAASVATAGGADVAGAASAATGIAGIISMLTGANKHAMGTDNAPGGLSWVGERGPELMNVPHGAQIIPNHNLPNLGQPAQDNTPLLRAMQENNSLMRQQNALTAAMAPKQGYGSSQGLYNLSKGQQQAGNVVNRRQIR
jgi:hypothetical protein